VARLTRLTRLANWFRGIQVAGEPIAYLVSFSVAERKAYGVRVLITDDNTSPQHVVTATDLPDLESQVRALAQAFGRDCFPYVRPLDPEERVPTAFYVWADSLKMQFIAYVPVSKGSGS
jgi:hypothetical protein